MKFRFSIVIFAGLLLMLGCSSMSISTDYDREADFSGYRTFGWMPQPDQHQPRNAVNNSLTEARIRKAVAQELQSRGYRMIENGKSDIRIACHVGVKDYVDVDKYGYGFHGRRVHTEVRHYKEGTFVLDFVDPLKQQLVWRGVANAALARPENSEEQITLAVQKILEQYPPQ